jgi:hypothetical protein
VSGELVFFPTPDPEIRLHRTEDDKYYKLLEEWGVDRETLGR